MRRCVVALALFGCRPVPPPAPAVPAASLAVAACPAGLARLGLAAAPASRDVSARYSPVLDSTLVLFDQGPVLYNRNLGVNAVSALMEVAGLPPAELGTLQLQVMVTSPTARMFAQRQLRLDRGSDGPLVLDPSVTSPMPAVSRTGAVVERVLFMVPADAAVAALRQPTVAGTLGATQLRLSDRERDGIRALLLFVMCGTAIGLP